jgi:hypothetical protein
MEPELNARLNELRSEVLDLRRVVEELVLMLRTTPHHGDLPGDRTLDGVLIGLTQKTLPLGDEA